MDDAASRLNKTKYRRSYQTGYQNTEHVVLLPMNSFRPKIASELAGISEEGGYAI